MTLFQGPEQLVWQDVHSSQCPRLLSLSVSPFRLLALDFPVSLTLAFCLYNLLLDLYQICSNPLLVPEIEVGEVGPKVVVSEP